MALNKVQDVGSLPQEAYNLLLSQGKIQKKEGEGCQGCIQGKNTHLFAFCAFNLTQISYALNTERE